MKTKVVDNQKNNDKNKYFHHRMFESCRKSYIIRPSRKFSIFDIRL